MRAVQTAHGGVTRPRTRHTSSGARTLAPMRTRENAQAGSPGRRCHTSASKRGHLKSHSNLLKSRENTSAEELDILRSIIARETCIEELIAELSKTGEENENSTTLLSILIKLRECSLQTIERIAIWRCLYVRPVPFKWKNINYVLKMASDLDFLSRCKAITAAAGRTLHRRNPFFTIPGLDRRFAPDEEVGIAGWHYTPTATALDRRILEAERLIRYEEKLFKPMKIDMDTYLIPILKKQAEYKRQLRIEQQAKLS